MRKYPLNEEIEFCENIKATPLHKVFLFGASIFMRRYKNTLKKIKDITVEEVKLDGFFIYILKPKTLSNTKNSCIINYHGGAFCYRGWKNHFELMAEYAIRTNSIGVYTEYRLSFNTKYQTGLKDCIKAYEYILHNKEKYAIDEDKILISGDSAGGYLALEVNDYLYKNQLKMPKGLMLVYPVVDPTMSTKSMAMYTDTPVWNAVANRKMWDMYLKKNREDGYLKKDVFSITNIYIETTEYDCLRDEALEMFERIQNQKGIHILNQTKKTCHGYDMDLRLHIVRDAIDKRVDFMNDILKK